MAISIRRRLPMYLGVISTPSSVLPPRRYSATAQGDNHQLGGRGRVSDFASASSSLANCCSACARRIATLVAEVAEVEGDRVIGFSRSFRAVCHSERSAEGA